MYTHTGGDESAAPDPEHAMQGSASSRVLGQHPDTGHTITVKSGPYGPYLEVTQQDDCSLSVASDSSDSPGNKDSSGGNAGVAEGAVVKKKRGRPKTKKASTVIRK